MAAYVGHAFGSETLALKQKFKSLVRRLAAFTGIPDQIKQLKLDVNWLNSSVARLNERLPKANVDQGSLDGNDYVDKGTQIALGIQYRDCASRGLKLSFADVEFRNHSQNGEDGILWYIFSIIGTTNRVAVEMCAGIGSECNSANLILNHGWYGLLYDGNESHVEQGQAFFNSHPNSRRLPPKMIHAWITKDNVNQLIRDYRFEGEIDLFSLDLDGIDYWIWEALEVVSPRVMVVEVQAAWMAERAVTVPYKDDFVASWVCINEEFDMHAQYGGASLPAFVNLARKKGYRLVGCNSLGFNAFFMRNDVGVNEFPEIDPATCFTHHVSTWANRFAMRAFEKLDWVEV